MSPAAVVFDFDNTLVKSSGVSDAAIIDILRRFGCVLDGADLARRVRRARNDEQLVRALVAPASARAAYEEVVAANVAAVRHIAVDPRIVDMVRLVRRSHTVYVYSARDAISLAAGLRCAALEELIPAFASELSPRGKPHPKTLLRLLLQHGHSPEDTVYVGDLLTDYWVSLNAGCGFLGAAWFHDRLPPFIAKCPTPERVHNELERALRTRHIGRRRSWKLARRAAKCFPKSGYSRNASA